MAAEPLKDAIHAPFSSVDSHLRRVLGPSLDLCHPQNLSPDALVAAVHNTIAACFQQVPREVAVAVSGGQDSMALLLLVAAWARHANVLMTGLTVNHGLRLESAQEAQQVAQWLRDHGIAHVTLDWSPAVRPTSGIQARARAARYQAMELWCLDKGVKDLFVAHHRDDVLETVAMRLQHQSGRDGLAAMRSVHWRRGIRVLRPLLAHPASVLSEYLSSQRQAWVSDSSNQDLRFERVRTRQALARPDCQPVRERLSRVATYAIQRRQQREHCTIQHIVTHVTCHPTGYATGHRAFFDAESVVVLDALRLILHAIGGRTYAPELPQMLALVEHIQHALSGVPTTTTWTLGRCLVRLTPSRWYIMRELRDLPAPQLLPAAGMIWDQRFWLQPSVAIAAAGSLWVRAGHSASAGITSANGRSASVRHRLPHAVQQTSPTLWSDTGELVAELALRPEDNDASVWRTRFVTPVFTQLQDYAEGYELDLDWEAKSS